MYLVLFVLLTSWSTTATCLVPLSLFKFATPLNIPPQLVSSFPARYAVFFLQFITLIFFFVLSVFIDEFARDWVVN